MPLSFNDFCFVFSLQAGVVATSTIGFTVMAITFFFNLYAPNSMESKVQICQYATLYIYLVLMMVAFGMAFMSSFWEKIKLIRISAILLGIGTLFYFILSIISYVRDNNAMAYVCPDWRCPDHHWLQDSRWRAVYIAMEAARENSTDELSRDEWSMSYQSDLYNQDLFRPIIQQPDLAQVELKEDLLKWADTKEETTTEGKGAQSSTNTEGKGAQTSTTTETEVTKPGRPTKKTREKDVLMLMFVSFVYTTAFLVFYVYTILTILAFASQLS
ncbi:unnamed protein product [Nezara viridula]|uniref:Uncharacterized protein n=1 Tax=Nezara viridula TaxID=85310 RepID=A0A9P0HMX1_NEZVI|nr:unnamed protein product [Nezara viridula]